MCSRPPGSRPWIPQDLLAEVLADTGVRDRLLSRLGAGGVIDDVLRQLSELEPAALATSLVTGIPAEDGDPSSFYRLAPIPNYFFQRDPQVVFGDRVLVSSMATDARERESLIARTVFESHPALTGYADLVDLRTEGGHRARLPQLEGGDVLIPSPEVILVGLSERTNRRGIEVLARYLRRICRAAGAQTEPGGVGGAQTELGGFRHLLVVELPAQRSYMHLDTVLTFIDHDLCLAYLPVVAAGGEEAGDVYHVDLNGTDTGIRGVRQPVPGPGQIRVSKWRWCRAEARRVSSINSASSGPTAPMPSPWRRASSRLTGAIDGPPKSWRAGAGGWSPRKMSSPGMKSYWATARRSSRCSTMSCRELGVVRGV